MEPTGMIVAVAVTRHHVLSALPDAPVVPEPPPRLRPSESVRRADPARRAAAGVLRRLADRVEPAPRQPAVG